MQIPWTAYSGIYCLQTAEGQQFCSKASINIYYFSASLVAQLVKNLPAMQETWVQSLGWEELLEKGMATHFSILAWRISWTVV